MGEKIEFTAWVVSIDSSQSLVGPKLCLRLTGETPKNLMDVLEYTRACHVTLEPLEPELEPCPFCGSDDVSIQRRRRVYEYFFVECNSCRAKGPEHEVERLVKQRWNRRAE